MAAGKGGLTMVPVETGDAVALTVVKVLQDKQVLPMIRACRDRNKAKRVFFKRDYAVGDKLSRKSLSSTGRRKYEGPGPCPGLLVMRSRYCPPRR
jgi:hypothetical protein